MRVDSGLRSRLRDSGEGFGVRGRRFSGMKESKASVCVDAHRRHRLARVRVRVRVRVSVRVRVNPVQGKE